MYPKQVTPNNLIFHISTAFNMQKSQACYLMIPRPYTEYYLETDSLDQFLVFRPSQEEKTLDMVLHTCKLATGTVDIQNLY